MHPKQNVFTIADNGKPALGGGGWGLEGQWAGLGWAGGGAWRAGRGLEGQRAGFGRAGLPPLKHRDVLGWS